MTGEDYAWIVTEQALEAPNVPTGILGLKLVNATSEKNHIKDSMYVSYLLY
jgi:ionotropic glutamate receptor NMDA 1